MIATGHFGYSGMGQKKRQPPADRSASVTEAFVKHESFLRRFLTRFLSRPQDIEDVVQDTYLKAYSAEQDREIHTPKAFLFRIARNAALKELTKKSQQLMAYIEEIDPSEINHNEASLDELVMAREKLGMFCQSALEMTPRCRRVFLMAKVYGFSYKEISKQLGISVSAIEKHVARGLEICNAYMLRMEQLDAASPVGTEKEYELLDKSGVGGKT